MKKLATAFLLILCAATVGVVAGVITGLSAGWVTGLIVGLCFWVGLSIVGLVLFVVSFVKEGKKLVKEVQRDFDDDKPFDSPFFKSAEQRFGQYGLTPPDVSPFPPGFHPPHPTPNEYFGKQRAQQQPPSES